MLVDADLDTGDWNIAFQALLTNIHLSSVGYARGLHACVIMPDDSDKVSEKIMATTMEALFAAVYLDAGLEAVDRVLETMGMTHEILSTVMFSRPHDCTHWVEGLHSSIC